MLVELNRENQNISNFFNLAFDKVEKIENIIIKEKNLRFIILDKTGE